MNFMSHRLKAYNREIIEIRHAPDGGTICPVCGALGYADEPSYAGAPGSEEASRTGTPPPAYPSFNICPTCNTQYGVDDYVDALEGVSIPQRWAELRRRWLAKIGWRPEALQQLRDNLDITVEPPEAGSGGM